MRSARVLAVICAALSGLALLAPAAHGFDAPRCNYDEITARPGLDRSYEIFCHHTTDVRLTRPPAAGRLSGLELEGGRARWRFEPDPGAPESDGFELELSGPAGSLPHTVAIRTIPRSENTPPVCDPVRFAERTDGTGPATVDFHVHCRDEENDEIVIEGDGPGTHESTPIAVPGGLSGGAVPWMRYRTQVHAGEELATYWGTDVLGARSEPAPIALAVGPAVDRPPLCGPSWVSDALGHTPILARPGKVRRFGIHCEDADGDPFEPRVVTAPRRGSLTTFAPSAPTRGHWGLERWIDATYVPDEPYTGADPFTVLPSGPRGDGPLARLAITTRPAGENEGGGCGWSPGRTDPGVPTVLELNCSDNDGDPLSAEVTEGPLHGITGVPVLTPALYGAELIRIPYQPRPGFTGIDLVEVRVSDDNGHESSILVDVVVERLVVAPGVAPPALFAPWGSGSGPAPPRFLDTRARGQSPARSPEAQARRLLGVPAVRLVRRIGEARLYAASGRSRSRSAFALTCALKCTLRIDPLGAGAAAGRRIVAEPGRGKRLSLRPTRAERNRRSFVVRLTVTDATGDRRSGRLRVAR